MAAVAAPRMFDKMSDARESSSRQSLAVIRSAIELYKAQEEAYPSSPKTDLTDYLKGAFPTCDVVGGNADVVVKTGTTALAVDTNSNASWIYNSDTGEFRINDASYIAW